MDDEIDEASSDDGEDNADDVDSDAETSPRRHGSTFGIPKYYGPRSKALCHDKLMIKEEMKFRKMNYNLNFFERYVFYSITIWLKSNECF